MISKHYFEKNKDKILETAKYLCKNNTLLVEEKFKELEHQYLNEDGTHHDEAILKNSSINIKEWLESIRHDDKENFLIYACFDNKTELIYKTSGNQHSIQINLDDIAASIYRIIAICKIRIVNLYVVHNHPFIYKASLSFTDCVTLNAINNELTSINENLNSIGMKSYINLYDFAVVTDFDYFSIMQTDF